MGNTKIEKHIGGEIMNTENNRTIQFPGNQEKVSTKVSRQIQNIDGIKYFNQHQIKLLGRTVRDQAAFDMDRNQSSYFSSWVDGY